MAMASKKRRLLLIAVGIALLLAAGVVAMKERSFRHNRDLCQRFMQGIHYNAVFMYEPYDENYNGAPAPDLKAALLAVALESPWYRSDLADCLACPGTGQEPGSLENIEDWMSYVYIDWSPYFGAKAPPYYYPLFYDKSMANHAGRGINILRCGSVWIFWDENAQWLKAFAAEHPEYEIVIPE